jgi:hypothetical protein
MPKGIPRTPAARAIIYAGIFGGLTFDEVNRLLEEAGFADQAIPHQTFESIRSNEALIFRENPTLLGEFIYKPRSRGWIKERFSRRSP